MRTEKQVLKGFRKLGYKITLNDEDFIILESDTFSIKILKYFECYECYHTKTHLSSVINSREHKLIHELIKLWRWIK